MHQLCNVSTLIPTRSPIRFTAACNDTFGSCSRASATRRIARSRSSFGYFLGAGTEPLPRGFRASTKPGAVHYGWDRTRLDGTEGTRIWTGQAVLAHNLVKIGALAG